MADGVGDRPAERVLKARPTRRDWIRRGTYHAANGRPFHNPRFPITRRRSLEASASSSVLSAVPVRGPAAPDASAPRRALGPSGPPFLITNRYFVFEKYPHVSYLSYYCFYYLCCAFLPCSSRARESASGAKLDGWMRDEALLPRRRGFLFLDLSKFWHVGGESDDVAAEGQPCTGTSLARCDLPHLLVSNASEKGLGQVSIVQVLQRSDQGGKELGGQPHHLLAG